MMKKKIIVFGSTGGTGVEVVKQALAEVYSVTAFLRNPEKMKIKDERLRIYQGDVLEFSDVYNAIKEHDIVCCSLGMPASDRSTLRADGTYNIVEAIKKVGCEKLICQTSLGYGDSKEVLPWHMKYIIVPFILKNAFKDHELQESVIEESGINYTIVRPGNMTNGKLTRKYRHGFHPSEKIKLKVSRADVAHFMLQQIDSTRYEGQKVGISY